MAVLPCLRILKPSSHFHWTHSGTDPHYLVNFWLGSLFFLVMTSWFSFCCLKQWFPKPVNKFWDLQNLSKFQIFFFSATQPQFSHVCFSSWWEMTRISLAFAQKQAGGITKLACSRCLLDLSPPPPPQNNPIKEFVLSLGPRLSLFSGTCQSITKVGSRRFVEGLPSGSLFVSPCLPECYLQIETKTEPDLKSLSVKNVLQCIYPGAYGLLIYPILSISHQQLSPLLLYMGLFTAPTWKKDLLLFSFGSSSGVTFWHDKKQSQGRYTTLLCW